MAQDQEFHDYIVQDVLGHIPGITSRAMFGGFSIYKDGIIFALIAYGTLYFKVDDVTVSDFEKRGSEQFTYERKGHVKTGMRYWSVPVEILEDPDLLERWVERAVEVSRRARKG